MFRMTVINRNLSVGSIRAVGVTGSSVLLVGDAQKINCTSVADTPPESIMEEIRTLSPESPPA